MEQSTMVTGLPALAMPSGPPMTERTSGEPVTQRTMTSHCSAISRGVLTSRAPSAMSVSTAPVAMRHHLERPTLFQNICRHPLAHQSEPDEAYVRFRHLIASSTFMFRTLNDCIHDLKRIRAGCGRKTAGAFFPGIRLRDFSKRPWRVVFWDTGRFQPFPTLSASRLSLCRSLAMPSAASARSSASFECRMAASRNRSWLNLASVPNAFLEADSYFRR